MRIRLIKLGLVPPEEPEEKAEQPPEEIPISVETLRSWIDEFKTSKAAREDRDLQRLNDAGKKL